MSDHTHPRGSRPGGREPTIPFARTALDRAMDIRSDPDAVTELLTKTPPRVVCATANGVVVEPDGSALRRLELQGEAARLAAGDPQTILLGVEGGAGLLAIDLDDSEEIGDGARVVGLRESGTVLPATEAGLAAYLSALLNWHRHHRFCAVCGTATEIAEAGAVRRCPNCGASHFPRTDPCVIMVVEHEDRILLGSRIDWPGARFSLLAGFVAPGETPEQAVAREVLEESGIAVRSVRYLASQPWPFPCSLMLGFEARADDGEPVAQPAEMAEVRWFTRAEVAAAARGDGDFELPGEVSIARILIDGWVAGDGARHPRGDGRRSRERRRRR